MCRSKWKILAIHHINILEFHSEEGSATSFAWKLRIFQNPSFSIELNLPPFLPHYQSTMADAFRRYGDNRQPSASVPAQLVAKRTRSELGISLSLSQSHDSSFFSARAHCEFLMISFVCSYDSSFSQHLHGVNFSWFLLFAFRVSFLFSSFNVYSYD